MRAGEAIFCDAYPAERERQVMRDQMESAKSMDDEPRPMLLLGVGVEVRSTTAMSRYWRRAESEHLFSSEVVSRAVRFEGEIGGELKPHQRQTLEDCAALLTHFGGSGARGLGACSFTIEAAKAAGA
jgi:CRISPR/Cas system CSM-associated protein Csm3 (group 7 of RAMP superfamily)